MAVLVARAGVLARAGGGGVLECFAAIGDPRCRRGIRHSLPTILGLCLAAVLAGCPTSDRCCGPAVAAGPRRLGSAAAMPPPVVDQGRRFGVIDDG